MCCFLYFSTSGTNCKTHSGVASNVWITVGQLGGPLLSIGVDKTEQFRKSKLGVVLEKFFLGIRNFRNFGLVSVVGLSSSATVATGARALNDK